MVYMQNFNQFTILLDHYPFLFVTVISRVTSLIFTGNDFSPKLHKLPFIVKWLFSPLFFCTLYLIFITQSKRVNHTENVNGSILLHLSEKRLFLITWWVADIDFKNVTYAHYTFRLVWWHIYHFYLQKTSQGHRFN